MDNGEQPGGLMNRLVSGIKDKTVRIAEDQLRKVIPVQESPEEAVLGLVASAVAAGAQRLEVRVESNDLILTHDGKMLHPTEATALGRGSGTHRELSQAVRMHLASPEAKLEIHFLSALGMHKAAFNGPKDPTLSDADLSDLKLARMTTQIVLHGTGNYRRVNQAMGNELPEFGLLRRRCFLAPLDLQLSGRPITRYSGLPLSLVTGSNFHREAGQALAALPSSPGLGITVDLSEIAGRLQTVKAGVCGIAKDPSEAGWYRVANGVARAMSEVAWPPRTWGFLVVSDDAPSGRLGEEVDLLSAAMVKELYDTYAASASTQEVGEEILGFLEQHRGMLQTMGLPPLDLDRTFLKLRQACSPSSDPRVLSNRLDLAASLEAAGQNEEAHQQYAKVLHVWESEALNHFDKYRFEEGAAVWQKALMLHEKLGTAASELAAKNLKLADIGKEQRLGFAEQAYRRALQLYRALPQADPGNELKALLGLAEILKKNRVLTESLRYAEDAEKAQLALCDGKETRDLVPVLKLQAELHDLLGDYARSTEFEQKALLLKFRR